MGASEALQWCAYLEGFGHFPFGWRVTREISGEKKRNPTPLYSSMVLRRGEWWEEKGGNPFPISQPYSEGPPNSPVECCLSECIWAMIKGPAGDPSSSRLLNTTRSWRHTMFRGNIQAPERELWPWGVWGGVSGSRALAGALQLNVLASQSCSLPPATPACLPASLAASAPGRAESRAWAQQCSACASSGGDLCF